MCGIPSLFLNVVNATAQHFAYTGLESTNISNTSLLCDGCSLASDQWTH